MRFTREQLEQFRDGSVPDLVGPGVRLLFVGINPSLWTAATGGHFGHPGNRFWPALHRAGLLDEPVDATAGISPQDGARVLACGIGITNLVNRATARADELSAAELRAGSERVRRLVGAVAPSVVAVAGITAYRIAFARRSARRGPQEAITARTRMWVVPNPSGLNAHETVATLAEAYREVGIAAGLVPGEDRPA